MELIKNLNIILRFVIEIFIVFIIGYCSFYIGKTLFLKILFSFGLPALVVLVWGMLGSPKAPFKLKGISRIILEVVLIAIGVIAIYHSKFRNLTIMFTIISLSNLTFMYLWKQN